MLEGPIEWKNNKIVQSSNENIFLSLFEQRQKHAREAINYQFTRTEVKRKGITIRNSDHKTCGCGSCDPQEVAQHARTALIFTFTLGNAYVFNVACLRWPFSSVWNPTWHVNSYVWSCRWLYGRRGILTLWFYNALSGPLIQCRFFLFIPTKQIKATGFNKKQMWPIKAATFWEIQ